VLRGELANSSPRTLFRRREKRGKISCRTDDFDCVGRVLRLSSSIPQVRRTNYVRDGRSGEFFRRTVERYFVNGSARLRLPSVPQPTPPVWLRRRTCLAGVAPTLREDDIIVTRYAPPFPGIKVWALCLAARATCTNEAEIVNEFARRRRVYYYISGRIAVVVNHRRSRARVMALKIKISPRSDIFRRCVVVTVVEYYGSCVCV